MISKLSQCLSVSALNVRMLPRRAGHACVAALCIALAVAVLLALLAMADGFERTLRGTGSSDVAMILRLGAGTENNGFIPADELSAISALPEVARAGDLALVSPEAYVSVDGKERADGIVANVAFRGLRPIGVGMRTQFAISDGRMYERGTQEVIVGARLAQQFSGLEVGHTLQLGATHWRIVGVFSTDGSGYESEIWGDLEAVQSAFVPSGSGYQSIRVKLNTGATLSSLREGLKAVGPVHLDAMSERDYYAGQAAAVRGLILRIGWILTVALGFGALVGATNMMSAVIALRWRESVSLRALGFRPGAIWFGFLTESLLIGLCGAAIGILLTFIFFQGLVSSTLGGNYTQVVFVFALTPTVIAAALIIGLGIGLIGGLASAGRTLRMPIAVT